MKNRLQNYSNQGSQIIDEEDEKWDNDLKKAESKMPKRSIMDTRFSIKKHKKRLNINDVSCNIDEENNMTIESAAITKQARGSIKLHNHPMSMLKSKYTSGAKQSTLKLLQRLDESRR